MHGSSGLFSDFVSALPSWIETRVLSYPGDVPSSKSELLHLIRSFVPASEPFVVLAESFSTPLSIEFAATGPHHLKGLILCAGFATSPLRGITRIVARYLVPFLPYLPARLAGDDRIEAD